MDIRELALLLGLALISAFLIQHAITMRSAGRRNLMRIDDILTDSNLIMWDIVGASESNARSMLEKARSRINFNTRADFAAAGLMCFAAACGLILIWAKRRMEPAEWLVLAAVGHWVQAGILACGIILCFYRGCADLRTAGKLKSLTRTKGAEHMAELQSDRTSLVKLVGSLASELRYCGCINFAMGIMLIVVVAQFLDRLFSQAV